MFAPSMRAAYRSFMEQRARITATRMLSALNDATASTVRRSTLWSSTCRIAADGSTVELVTAKWGDGSSS